MFRLPVIASVAFISWAVSATASADCAWPGRTNKESFNVAFPDTSSTYWSHPYRLSPGMVIEISGEYVNGRYFSLNTYTLTGDSIDGLADAAIAPEPGSQNPFQGDGAAVAGSKKWRVHLQPGAQAAVGSNTLRGTSAGSERGWGILIYRVYLPNDERDEKAGVPLPSITLRRGEQVERLTQCEKPAGSFVAEAFIRLFGPQANIKPKAQPVFIRPESAEGFFPNRDNKYLAALTRWQPGRLVVVRGKAPVTPDLRKGDPITGSYQMRYWSMCTNQYRQPWPVNDCVADADVVRNAAGEYTIVVSTAEDRPVNATKENGVTWLAWGPTTGTGIVLLRHMLPAPDFKQAAQHVKPGETGARVMGPFAPVGRYCDRKTYEERGTKGCGF